MVHYAIKTHQQKSPLKSFNLNNHQSNHNSIHQLSNNNYFIELHLQIIVLKQIEEFLHQDLNKI